MLLSLAVAAGVLLQTFNADLPDYDSLAQYRATRNDAHPRG